ncbi:MAG: Guanylate kinase [Candidatus Anoxychlamydiales bacterium]|nr:Guanylate kinase [Candidatus Anoxychlamydiales bacterium]
MQKLIGNLNKGRLFVVSAPSGSGKTTLVRMLTKEFPNVIESVSFTTREIRNNEKKDLDYFYISKEEFEKKIKEKEFLEYASVFDNYYGTSKKVIEKDLINKKHVVLVIDTQGAKKLINKIDATFIFIAPLSIDELKNRLKLRQQNNDSEIEKRLSWAKEELKEIKHYDYLIINDDLKIAYEILKSIFIAEDNKIKNGVNFGK